MCTVTYLPYQNGFILTHNRDEAPTRSPNAISREPLGKDVLLFPRDTKAGGAWIGSTRSGKTACLLNGAFVKHKHEPPYRRSRGLMLLDFFECPEPDRFFSDYTFSGIEPFTFLFFRREDLIEFRWDGVQGYLSSRSPSEPHFWCSATLYPPEMQTKREQVFRDWWQQKNLRFQEGEPIDRLPADIYHLHQTGSVNDPENDYIMNRGGRVQTVSITQVVYAERKTSMYYEDLLEKQRHRRRLSS